MSDDSQIAKLDAILQRDDLVIKPSKYLRTTFIGTDGKERPLNVRNYQIQMILHLFVMRRFVVGDDCGLGKCVTGDTLVSTDQGLRRIDELHDWSRMDADTFQPPKSPVSVVLSGEIRPVVNFYRGGVKPTVTATTRYGFQNTGSYVHPIMVRRDGEDQWVKMSDLRTGDYVCIDRTESIFPDADPDLPVPDPDTSVDKTVPWSIMRGTRESVRQFLCGYFDFDGSVSDDIEVSSASAEPLRQVQVLLLRFGIVSRRVEVREHTHTYWRLALFGNDARRFRNVIRFESTRKAATLDKNLGGKPEFHGYFYDPVVSLVHGEHDVFDLEVGHPDHSFIGNGFVNHNTLSSIAACCYLWDRGEAERVVVLTKKSVVNQWADEVARFADGVATFPVKGTPKQRAKVYDAYKAHDGPAVLIMGYRSAVQDFDELMGWKIGVFILDEVTMVKNAASQVHQVVRYLASPDVSDRVWGLTATLIKNNLLEGYGIYRCIVPGLFHPTESAFMNDFCIVQMQPIGKGRKIPVVVGYKRVDIERFKAKIRPYYLGRPKHAVAKELPVLTTKIIKVGMSAVQHLKYAEALAGLLLVGEDEKEVTKLTAVTYCQEIVNHPGLIQCEGDSEKLDALVEMLTDGDLEGEKVIVYTRFERMVTLGVAALTKAGVKCVRVTGAETEDQRATAQRLFQDPNSDAKVIWITNAGNDAINLQAANALIFFDSPFSAGDYLQTLGRMIRIGSIHTRVQAIHLVAQGTIDERVLMIKDRKMGLVEAVIGKRIKGEEDSDLDILNDQSDIDALFAALREDAKGLIRG